MISESQNVLEFCFIEFSEWLDFFQNCRRYWIDKESALKVDQRTQKALWLFACTNSCMNPIVYGLFNIPRRASDKVSTIFHRNDFQFIFSIPNSYCFPTNEIMILTPIRSIIWLSQLYFTFTHLTRITIISAFQVDTRTWGEGSCYSTQIFIIKFVAVTIKIINFPLLQVNSFDLFMYVRSVWF